MDINQLYSAALAAQRSGREAEAEQLYRQILDQMPVPEALVNLGNLLARQGRHGEALPLYDQALAARPDFLEALFNRAGLLLEQKNHDGALENYDRILALRPDMAAAWNNRGSALRALARLEDALASFTRAAALNPGHVNALVNRAMALWDLRRLEEALAAAQSALSAQPGHPEALYVRANILRDLGRMAEALAGYEQTLSAQPAHPHALNGAAQAALALSDWQKVDALTPRLKDNAANGPALIQPFVLLGYDDDPALQRRCAENYINRTVPARQPLAAGRYSHDRIRLAYLSADFHQHPTAQLMVELFERHDRARFDVMAIAFGPDDNSPMRARLKKAVDHFEDVRGRSDTQVAQWMRAREIDIAIDLNGHTMGARPGILAHRPAPVAVNYLVYPGTMGAPFIDYILADRIVLPMDQQPFCRERILHLPDCYQANDATRALAPPPSRAEARLPPMGFVFCCLNNGWKITRPLFDIWMQLLHQVAGSLLWLLDGPHADNLRRQAQARGIDPARLVFAPKVAPDAHLARHQLADLFLDTLPYGAHTSCSEALWAGLPVVTCYGKSFTGRVAASLLKAIDLPELVATNLAGYERLALDLATNPALLAATRQKLARNRPTTPLYDSDRFRKNIEAAYETMLG